MRSLQLRSYVSSLNLRSHIRISQDCHIGTPRATGLGPRRVLLSRLAGAGAAVPLTTCMAKGALQKTRAKAVAQERMKSSSRQPTPSGANGDGTRAAVPRIIAFDLDGTLWWPEMYSLRGPPFKAADREGRLVKDGSGETVRLMGASHDVLRELVTAERFCDTEVAYISRCDYPPWADACLALFEAAPGVTLAQAAQYSEIYYGSKVKHFRQVHKASGVPYRQMLFFDNEARNCRDVAGLGVTCVYTPEGMTAENWQQGLQKYAKAAAQWSPSNIGGGSPRGSDPFCSKDGDEWGGYW